MMNVFEPRYSHRTIAQDMPNLSSRNGWISSQQICRIVFD